MAEASNRNGNGMILATGGHDHAIRLWQPHTGVCVRVLQHADSHCNTLEITPDRQLLAAGGYQHIRMYDLNSTSLNPVVNYDGITRNITGVGFQEDGKWMFTGGDDCSARIWDLRSRNLQCQRIFQVRESVNCVCLHPNQSELIVGDQGGVIHLWDLKTDHNEQLIPEAQVAIQAVDIDPAGNYLAAVNSNGACYIWSLTGGVNEEPTKLSPKQKIDAHHRYALSVKFSPDSTYLGTTSADHTAKIFKTSDWSLYQTFTVDDQRWVWDLAFSADSQYLFTGSSDGIAKLWNIETGSKDREYVGHTKGIISISFRDQTTPP